MAARILSRPPVYLRGGLSQTDSFKIASLHWRNYNAAAPRAIDTSRNVLVFVLFF